MRPLLLIGGWLAAAALVCPATATAQAGGPTDPDATSPSGVIYEIPLEGARRDAAPKSRRGDARDRNSAFRSENNFGSSSTVPGAPGDDSGGGGGAAGGSGSSGGGGSSAGGDKNAAGGLTAGATSAADDPSVLGMVILILVVLAGAVLSAVAAIRARRSSS